MAPASRISQASFLNISAQSVVQQASKHFGPTARVHPCPFCSICNSYLHVFLSLALTYRPQARLYNIPPRRVRRWLATRLTGGERSVPMRVERLRATHHYRVLTQRWLLGASRFCILFYFLGSVLLRLGRCVNSSFRQARFMVASARSREATFTARLCCKPFNTPYWRRAERA